MNMIKEAELELRHEAEQHAILQEEMAADSKKIDSDIRRIKEQENEFL